MDAPHHVLHTDTKTHAGAHTHHEDQEPQRRNSRSRREWDGDLSKSELIGRREGESGRWSRVTAYFEMNNMIHARSHLAV